MTTPAHFVPASQLARSGRSEEIVAKHKKYLWPSVTNYFQQPLVADRGEIYVPTAGGVDVYAMGRAAEPMRTMEGVHASVLAVCR